jgi:hypothetical protein
MTLKKLILIIMVALLGWLLLVSLGIVAAQAETIRETCNLSLANCSDSIYEQNQVIDTITKILAYTMILFGSLLLVINWRLSLLETIRLTK